MKKIFGFFKWIDNNISEILLIILVSGFVFLLSVQGYLDLMESYENQQNYSYNEIENYVMLDDIVIDGNSYNRYFDCETKVLIYELDGDISVQPSRSLPTNLNSDLTRLCKGN